MESSNFIFAAFGITAAVALWLIISNYASMRKSEALADDLKNDRLGG